MKKIVYLSLLIFSMNSLAQTYGTLRFTGNYTNFTTSKLDINKEYYNTLTDIEKAVIPLISGKTIPSFGGGLALDATHIFDNGLTTRLGGEITAEYNQNRIQANMYKELDPIVYYKYFENRSSNQILTGYVNAYSLVGYSYKINNDLFLLMGPKVGMAIMFNYNDERYLIATKDLYQQAGSLLKSYIVPFSALFEVNYKRLSVNIEIGGKYLIKKEEKVFVSSGATDYEIDHAKLKYNLKKNDLTYDLKILDKDKKILKNKVVFSTSISVGINF